MKKTVKRLNGKQVNAILIKMGAKSMPERMTGKSVLLAQPVLMGMDMPGKEKGVNGPVLSILFGEEKFPGLSALKPVSCKQVNGRF